MSYNLGDKLPDAPIVFLQKMRDEVQGSINNMERRRLEAAGTLSQYERAIEQLRATLIQYETAIALHLASEYRG